MTDENQRLFAITLPDLFPEGLDFVVLAKFAKLFERAVRLESGRDEKPEDGLPLLSLVNITRGSARYGVHTAPASAQPVRRLLNAATNPALHWEKIDPEAREPLEEAFKTLKSVSSEVLVSGPLLGQAEMPYVSHESTPEPAVVKGETEIAVYVLSVDGKKAKGGKVLVRPLGGGENVRCTVLTDDVLQAIGARVKKQAIIGGIASWAMPKWSVVDFAVKRFRDYPSLSMRAGLTPLAAALGSEQIDAAITAMAGETEEAGE
jgi:hypothetical protein